MTKAGRDQRTSRARTLTGARGGLLTALVLLAFAAAVCASIAQSTPERPTTASGTQRLRLDERSTQADDGRSTLQKTLEKKEGASAAVVAPVPAAADTGHFLSSPLGLTLIGAVLAFALGLALMLASARDKGGKDS